FLVNVFRHHDAVVNHKSGCQHNAQHSEYVNGKATEVHDKEGGYQGHGNIDHGANGNSPITEKEIDDKDHQDDGDDKGFFHFSDRPNDEDRLVHRDVELDIFGDLLLDLIHPF